MAVRSLSHRPRRHDGTRSRLVNELDHAHDDGAGVRNVVNKMNLVY